MNIKALNKLESAWIKLDWREWIIGRNLTDMELNRLVEVVDIFHNNRSAKQIVIAKLGGFPAYVVLDRKDYLEFLDWICTECSNKELYECCSKTQKIKEKLCSNLKKSLKRG